MLEIKNVNFSYQEQSVFKDLSLKLQDQKITTIIGPNGSGKSTLFKIFTRAIRPESGQVYLDKTDIWQMPANDFAKKVAIVHQQNPLYDEIKVIDLIKMGRLPYSSLLAGKVAASDKINEILELLELVDLKNKNLSDLSGGQRQRIWLAVALAQEPEYLFLDEPTTYLDLHFQYQFLKLLKKLNQGQQLTICMILHDLNQALQFSDQVILLNNGEIKATGSPTEVITAPIISENFKINCELIETKKGTFLQQY